MRYVTLVNRTQRVLEGFWDGKVHLIHPGKNQFPETLAYKFKAQHPVMGSQDPYTLEMQYLLGVEDEGDPITPIEQSDSIELLDRSKLRNPVPVVVVEANGLFRPSERTAGLSNDGPGFSKP